MAFLRSFFGNSAQQDESFALESLEQSLPTTDNLRGKNTLHRAGGVTLMDADTTPTPTLTPTNTIPMDADITDITPLAMPTDTLPMDADTTLTPTNITSMDADTTPPAMPTDTLPMDANTMPPIIPTSIIPTVADTTPPVMPTNTLPMDADTTLPAMPASTILTIANTTLTPTLPTGTTPMDADTIPTPAIPTDGDTPGSFPLGGEGTMVLYKRPFAPESASAMPPPKVLLREVDQSSTLRTQVYDLRKSLYHRDADFNILEGRFRQKEASFGNLEAQIRGKDVVIAEQAQLLSQLRQGLEEVKEQTIAQSLALAQVGSKDTMIAQQSEALHKLQRDLTEVRNNVLLDAKAEIQWLHVDREAEIQRLHVDRESEMLALNQKYELTLHKLQELQSRPPMVADPSLRGKHASRPRRLICHYLDEQQDQEQLEAPAPEMLAPAAPNLNNHVPQGVNDDPPWTSSTSSRRGRRKMQGLPEVVDTEEQRLQNLAHVRDLFKTAFKVTQDEEFLQCGGVSSQIAKKFTRIKKRVERAKPRVHDNLSVETGVEVATRLAHEKDEALKKARRDTWRRTKYRRRKEITKSMVAVKEAKGDDDVVAWRFLNSLITTLGSDGMSSEDSNGEDTEAIFCTRTLPWRRDIVRELQIVDQQRLRDSTIFSPRGAKAAKRIRGDNFPQSEQKAVKGLPHPFYNEGWLAQNKGTSSDEPFRWMTIYVQS
ncbi:hypothetical protein PISMIDRAFT_18548 [Pisolithus microcarpus 441]|uniref:Uncharacterized protein n=1 Tax=Pisolithus microcarpus 441 TaxID=765257 RepID=A0A0C9YXM9_9AGAM|nr:hypothetical protein PISMIDRAFT_18548 [Pisolithus microcarpus 441]